MEFPSIRPGPETWLAQLFSAKSARNGGVVRRSIRDVERKIGRRILELEVRRRGFHLIESATQFIIICDPSRIITIC
jgi:hypothetical protein